MAEHAVSTYSYEAYLALEAESDVKHEYHDGMIVAMAGGSPKHGQIGINVGGAIGFALRQGEKDCSVYSSDVRIQIETSFRTFYPDLSVVCGPLENSPHDPHAIINPILIVEVLFESTAAFDRGEKFAHYRQLPSLKEYVLVSQEEAMVDTFYRNEAGLWEIHTLTGLNEEVTLKSLGIALRMQDVYYRVPDLKP